MSIHVAPSSEQAERAKYEDMWSVADYRKFSPGMQNVERFLSVLNPPSRSSIVDIGCGEGGAGLRFAEGGMAVNWVDITESALDPRVPRSRFMRAPIWSIGWRAMRPGTGWDYGFCCDVLEHIPPEYAMLCLEKITSACRTSWLQVCNVPDQFGAVIGKQLHLTVRPFSWWRDRIGEFGDLIEARDLCGNSLFVVQS